MGVGWVMGYVYNDYSEVELFLLRAECDNRRLAEAVQAGVISWTLAFSCITLCVWLSPLTVVWRIYCFTTLLPIFLFFIFGRLSARLLICVIALAFYFVVARTGCVCLCVCVLVGPWFWHLHDRLQPVVSQIRSSMPYVGGGVQFDLSCAFQSKQNLRLRRSLSARSIPLFGRRYETTLAGCARVVASKILSFD